MGPDKHHLLDIIILTREAMKVAGKTWQRSRRTSLAASYYIHVQPCTSCYRNWDKLRPGGPQLARMQTLLLLYLHYQLQHLKYSSHIFKVNYVNFQENLTTCLNRLSRTLLTKRCCLSFVLCTSLLTS